MKKILIVIALVLALMATLAGAAFAATGTTDPQDLADLAKVRQATAKYHDVNVAIADGYILTDECDEIPGTGGMGYHYFNPSLGMDTAVNLTTPEILMYESSSKGLRLVGVEYFVGIGAPDSPIPNPAPSAPVCSDVPSMVRCWVTYRECLHTMTCMFGLGSRIQMACSQHGIRK